MGMTCLEVWGGVERGAWNSASSTKREGANMMSLGFTLCTQQRRSDADSRRVA